MVAGAAGVAALGACWLRQRGNLPLSGRTVLITGGSRGLGLVLAREFGRRGCSVAICARDDRELASASLDLRRRGVRVLALRADVSDAEAVADLVSEVEGQLGPIDVLVNNAGVIQVGPAATMSSSDFDDAMDVIFRGTLNTTLEVVPRMIERERGRIVNITSIGGRVPVPHLLPYVCAKSAVVGFSEGLSTELSGTGVRVTTVVPGLMRTGSAANARFKGDDEAEFTWFALAASTPLTSMSAERAARRIVRAARRGETFVVLTWQAKLMRLAHDLLPSATVAALGMAGRLLPPPELAPTRGGATGGAGTRGMKLAHPLAPSALTALGNRAARRNNEYGGTPEPSPEHAHKAGLPVREGRRHFRSDGGSGPSGRGGSPVRGSPVAARNSASNRSAGSTRSGEEQGRQR